MPSKGKAKVTDTQRARIAAGKISGRTSKQIAHETGLAPVTVRKQLVRPDTKASIQALKNESAGLISSNFARAQVKIGKMLDSKDPDQMYRGVQMACKVPVLGEAVQRIDPPRQGQGEFTLQDLLEAELRAKEEAEKERTGR